MIALAGLFVALALWEWQAPAHKPQPHRWALNGALGLVSLALGRLSLIAGPVAAAILAEENGWGLFNLLSVPTLAEGALTILLMDGAVYWQHRAFHRLSWLWRWHRLHHGDTAFDLSTGLRFHPVEALISLAFKAACVLVLGAPVWAVPLFELWLMAGSLFEHANINIPGERTLRHLLVTPAMHRVHHSAHGDDAQHNFGFAIAFWDRLFGSYRAQPSGEKIGLPS